MNTEKLGRGIAGKKLKQERAQQLVGTLHNSKDGQLQIIGYEGSTRVTVRFTATGYESVVSLYAIQQGTVFDRYKPTVCGIGYVDVKFRIPTPIRQKAYQCWYDMLKRCNNPEKHNYTDVTVDPRWHSFKNFCEDITELEGYDRWVNEKSIALDKDIKVKGNRTYGKQFCKFVTVGENAIDAVARKMETRWIEKQKTRKQPVPVSGLSVQW
ncbi:hypothetical protein D3C75_185490 [compost metagenome]